jgi:hypothetical protein
VGHKTILNGCGEEDVLPLPGFETWSIQHVANYDSEYTLPQLSAKLPLFLFIIFSGPAAQHGLWPPHPRGFLITHYAPKSVVLLWMSDQLTAETST